MIFNILSSQFRRVSCVPVISLFILLAGVSSNAYSADSITGAEIVKLHVYKDYRSVVQLNKGSDTNSNGCTHSNKKLLGLVLDERYEADNTAAVEEIYAALLAARLTDTPVDILTSGCEAFGGFTIPVIIRVIL